jgi:hypothetical protein
MGVTEESRTYCLKVGVRDLKWYLMPELDTDSRTDPIGPFSEIETAERYIGHAGGGRLNTGRVVLVIPDRGPSGQLPLLRFFNGIGWRDYLWLEDHPRA